MIGLDTNVIVRYIVQDDPKQSSIASHIFEDRLSDSNHGFVSAVTLCEVVWVLARGYRVGKPKLCEVLQTLLDAEEIDVEHRDLVQRALAHWRTGKADFSDYLIGECARSTGAETTLSFDKSACSSDLFTSAETY